MDGEIDIEEHDLMENPAIKKIFPDISILKKEINYYGEEETTMKQVCLDNSLKDSELVPSSLANTKVYESNTNTLEISKKYLPSCNINLNNVDQSFMVEIKESGKQTHKEKNIHNTISQLLLSCKVIADRLTNIPIKENALSAKKMQSNKIILGSKPNKEIDYEEFFKKQVNLHELRVLVDDLKPYLERSKRYCGDCYILFPTTSEFENHLRIIHFHLFTPRKTGFRFKYQKFGHSKFRCTICKGIYSTNGSLTRHYKNIHCIQKSSNKTATMRSNIRNKNHKLIDNRVPENRTKENPQLNYRSNLNLSNQTEKNDSTICDTFVLKSTLFKCIKCDVHFVSSKTAKNHLEHMEMLINWKCCICQRIFKENDSVLHEKQHSFSNSFTVYELKQSDLAQVLYSCPKCTVHFNEEFFLNHYPRCGLETAETVYCKICDILLDRSISTSHETSHLNWGSELTKTSTVVCDILIKEAWDNSNSVKGTKECKRKSDTNFKGPVPKKKMLSNTEFICNLLYCSICKCFVSIRQRNLHFSSRCKNLKTRICIICGLVITNKSYANHLILHDKMQNLKLQDFRFIDIKTGKLMCPPVPEFKKCNNCQVNFVTKMDICRHKCMDDDFLTCHICQMKLSEDAFKLHMSYHYYSIKNRKVGRSFSSILPKLYSQIDINIPFEGEATVENIILDAVTSRSSSEYVNIDLPRVLFSCGNCFITVDTYDKVVEHCQNHYNDEEKDFYPLKCNICNLNFECTSYNNHQKWHLKEGQSNFRIFKFDVSYFTSESDVWLKHVFGSLPPKDIMEVIGNSIYKSEHRIKMEVIQEGPADFTVYQCHKCSCFIDSNSIYRHADNACFKLRKHACSHCGLPFISSFSRIQHESVHSTPNIGLKSYRIVIFNRNEDELLNNRLKSNNKYVLYLCRNCNIIVEKSQTRDHKCNRNDVRKCLSCGLLFKNLEYESHILKHKELTKFTGSNMKVIMFGEKSGDTEVETVEELGFSFKGMICDYTIYSCNKCKNCETTEISKSKHKCPFVSTSHKCNFCELYFITSNFKHHRKMHESDPDFLRKNMRVVTFGLSTTNDDCDNDDNESKIECSRSLPIGNSLDTPVPKRINDVVSPQGKSDNVTEQNAKIYKCTCGLHFLDELSVSTHFKICTPRIRAPKQTCSKCELLFTPNILFSHLLLHHGNKKINYKFQIVEITSKLVPEIFKCSKCKLHFVRDDAATNHFKTCTGQSNESVLCTDCNLIFNSSCLPFHKDNHHKNGIRKNKVVVIDEYLQENCSNQKTSKDDCVINKDNHKQNECKNDLKECDSAIYKCKECTIHYLTRKQITLHLRNKHKILTQLQDICNICGLNFVSSVLPRHIYFHHEKLNIKPHNLNIIEYTHDDCHRL